MNRQILFRGFHPDENGTKTIQVKLVGHNFTREYKGEWVYGLPFSRIGGGFFPDGVNAIRIDGGKQNIFGVVAETVCQFTELTDTNGNKIYEGDIVKITDETINGIYYARVEFGNPNGQYNWSYQLVPMCKMPFGVYILQWVDMEETGAYIEVIGNIYENERKIGALK